MNDASGNPAFNPSEMGVDAVIVLDSDGRIVDWPRTAETLFGWKRPEAVGRLAASLLIPDPHRDVFWEGMQACQHSQTSDATPPPRRPLSMQDKAGQEVLMEFQTSPLHLEGRNYYLGLLRNLSSRRSEQRDASRKLVQSQLLHPGTALSSVEDSFEKALQKSVDAVCTITGCPLGHALIPDPSDEVLQSAEVWHIAEDDRLKEFNFNALEVELHRGEGLAGRIWATAEPLWISNIQESEEFVQKTFKDAGLRGAFGFPILVDDEVVAILEFFAWEEWTPDSQMLLIVDNLSDQLGRIIERRRWIEERARLAAIVDSSYDAIIGKDMQGRIISWNTGAEQVYGYTAVEVLGTTGKFLLPEGMDEEEAVIRDVIRTGQRLDQFETKRRCQDGRLIEVALTVSPIRDSRGQIVGSSTIERDVTLRKKREKELRLAKQEADKANQAKSEFLANISHELRTPMNAILGMLNLGLGEDLSEVMRDYLTTARDSAQTLLYLLNDLLDFSRMEAGRFELEVEPFRLRETLDAAMKSLALPASEKGLELICHISPKAPNHLQGDGMRLRQILVNLAGNAIKFTSQGEVVVNVDVLSRQGQEVTLEFSVRDTGIGIPKEDQERIFTPFTQVDASTTRTATGSGLGLAIVRELVDKMGGTVQVESEVGKGSRFSFLVPFLTLTDPPQEPLHAELAHLPVLVVDDNRTNQRILKETLANWSMTPTVVSSAQAALKAIRAADEAGRSFPLIIVDALMPEMDGFMLVEKLKQERDQDLMPITVLMLSSADRQTFKKRCEQLDVAAYLEKPVSQSELLDTVMTVLKGPPLHQESVRKVEPTPRSLKVLLAEDTPANQKVVRAILEKRGHWVHLANNGREAVDHIKQQPFDVVLMDVQMPTMDGLQATQVIRQLSHDWQSQVPIIAMTAHARREDRRKCLAAGMDAYIAKPMDAAKLIHLIETVQHRTDVLRPSDTWEGPPVALPSESSVPRINIQSALARMDGDEELVRDLAHFFLEDAAKYLVEIEQALAEGQADAVERPAHSLKGLAANFDAETLIMAAMNMEELGRNGELRKAQKLFPELRRAVRGVTSALKRFLDMENAT